MVINHLYNKTIKKDCFKTQFLIAKIRNAGQFVMTALSFKNCALKIE